MTILVFCEFLFLIQPVSTSRWRWTISSLAHRIYENGSAWSEDGSHAFRPNAGMSFGGMMVFSLAAAAAARLVFYPSLLYNVLLEKMSSRKWFHRIDETVILGALPFRGMSQQLVEEENVRGVITMNETYETWLLCNTAEEWQALGVEQLRLSTVDLTGVPTLENLQRGVKFALKHRQHGNSVYIHCKAGRSRSATMAAAYLIAVNKWSPQEAIRFIANIRPYILVRRGQLQALERFYATESARWRG
ncbi:phosphatidylglycerophosphatase and protein-tyrosine phosphatase 1 isoform X2 [Rhinatrema bivittatum]|uniref:phosphatidylglycerophosphatase and protein-tyrosine phosphatase 1 isoform X2 n=1 Tax=Rhinatrema bivittatum TaxID=194408 RepID=UPI00112DAA43|nr:phosphatidylglycerophosphatase and protein-tyrosine phosphatase 1 isoform X2 [Rhinatrema bivittatum]